MPIARRRPGAAVPPLLLGLALAACGTDARPGSPADSGAVPAAADSAAAGISADSATALARAFLRASPEGASYLPDSVRVVPTDSSWQVFVRHVEWAIRRPPETLLEVSRVTGRVRQVPLK